MKIFIILSKKSLAIILATLIVLLILIGQIVSADVGKIDGSTHAKRIAYLKSLNLQVDDSNPTSKAIIIPESFNDVYNQYNIIQKKAGFDLSNHKGKTATLYTYSLNSESNVHVIVCDNVIIGGDIAEISINGNIKPLTRI